MGECNCVFCLNIITHIFFTVVTSQGGKEDTVVAHGSSAHDEAAKETNAGMRPLGGRVSAGIVFFNFASKNN